VQPAESAERILLSFQVFVGFWGYFKSPDRPQRTNLECADVATAEHVPSATMAFVAQLTLISD